MDDLVKRLRDAAIIADSGNAISESLYSDILQVTDVMEDLSKTAKKWELEAAALQTDKEYLVTENRKLVDAWINALNLQNRWIPVTEQLPVHDMNVLVCYDWTGRSGTVYREVEIASIEELERDPTEMFRPVAWMPLPEPPKEES